MSLIDDLAPIFADINADLVSEFGARVDVFRLEQTARTGNTKAKAYVADADLVGIPAEVLDPVTAAKRNLFGLTSKAEMFLLLANVDDVLPSISNGDGFKFASGPYAGRLFIADADGMPDAQGVTLGVSVTNAPNGTVMA